MSIRPSFIILPTVIFRVYVAVLVGVALVIFEDGLIVAVHVYTSKGVADSDEIANVIWYTPLETSLRTLAVCSSAFSVPFTTTSPSTVRSSWMVQLRVSGSP